MKTYFMSFRYSKNGKSWTSTSTSVKAESDMGAIEQVKSRYDHIKDIKINRVK